MERGTFVLSLHGRFNKISLDYNNKCYLNEFSFELISFLRQVILQQLAED